MELMIGGIVIAVLLIALYYTAKRNGKLEEQNRTKSKVIEGILKDFDTLQAQMFRWDSWRESVQDRLRSVDVALLSDDKLSELYRDPTTVSEQEHTVAAKLEEIKPTK
jgi:hypothetical protein